MSHDCKGDLTYKVEEITVKDNVVTAVLRCGKCGLIYTQILAICIIKEEQKMSKASKVSKCSGIR